MRSFLELDRAFLEPGGAFGNPTVPFLERSVPKKGRSGSPKECNKIVKKICHLTLPITKNSMKNDSKHEVIYWNSHWLKKMKNVFSFRWFSMSGSKKDRMSLFSYNTYYEAILTFDQKEKTSMLKSGMIPNMISEKKCLIGHIPFLIPQVIC